jgi:hypothetical protein
MRAGADVLAGRRVSLRGELLQRGVQKFLAVSRHSPDRLRVGIILAPTVLRRPEDRAT